MTSTDAYICRMFSGACRPASALPPRAPANRRRRRPAWLLCFAAASARWPTGPSTPQRARAHRRPRRSLISGRSSSSSSGDRIDQVTAKPAQPRTGSIHCRSCAFDRVLQTVIMCRGAVVCEHACSTGWHMGAAWRGRAEVGDGSNHSPTRFSLHVLVCTDCELLIERPVMAVTSNNMVKQGGAL